MPLFIVPSNYNESIHRNVTPICIRSVDDQGNRVHFEWVQYGVIPVAEKLAQIAVRFLRDRWHVSEITEAAVHTLSRNRGLDLGDHPSRSVLAHATWQARDLRAGGRRARRRAEVGFFAQTFEQLADQVDFVESFLAKDTLDRLEEQLSSLGMEEVRSMVPLMLWGADASEIERTFSRRRNTISQQFYRGMRKAAFAAGLMEQPLRNK